jgi:myo-inositol-1(or 4)-monophosphatase
MAATSAFLNTAVKAAYLAGNAIQQASRNVSSIKVHKKGVHDFVSELDKEAERIIISTISRAYPSHNFLAEESGMQDNHDEYTWIIDPIDGTTNFIHGHPQYAVSIALKHKNKIILGVVFDPNRNDLYKAEIGSGAYLNDKRIRVSNTSILENALLATGFPSTTLNLLDQYLAIFKDMLINTSGQRRSGSAALDLAYVATGYVDGFWEFNLKQWDYAAGFLLVKESGGLVTDFSGNNSEFWNNGNIVAANPKILPHMLKIIKEHL